MSTTEAARGRATVIQPDEGDSFWQPVPANGHADPKLTPANTRFDALSMGYQTIAPGSRVREHSHGDQIELQICFRGRGRVVVDGVSHPLVPGPACFLGYDVKRDRPPAHAGRARAGAVRAARERGRNRARAGDE